MRALLVILSIVSASSAARAERWYQRWFKPRVAVVLPHGVEIRRGDPRAIAAEERANLDTWVRGARGHGAAKQHLIIALPRGARIQTLEPGAYSKSPFVDKSQLIRLTGFKGDVKAIHLGTMSVHDLYSEYSGRYDQATFDERAEHDMMAIAVDGTRLVDRVKSGVVAMHDIVIPRGAQALDYIRQDRTGREFGKSGYTMGRLLRLSWDP